MGKTLRIIFRKLMPDDAAILRSTEFEDAACVERRAVRRGAFIGGQCRQRDELGAAVHSSRGG